MYRNTLSNVSDQLKMSSTIMFVFVSSSRVSPLEAARDFHTLSTSWMKQMNVAGPLVGPNGMTV